MHLRNESEPTATFCQPSLCPLGHSCTHITPEEWTGSTGYSCELQICAKMPCPKAAVCIHPTCPLAASFFDTWCPNYLESVSVYGSERFICLSEHHRLQVLPVNKRLRFSQNLEYTQCGGCCTVAITTWWRGGDVILCKPHCWCNYRNYYELRLEWFHEQSRTRTAHSWLCLHRCLLRISVFPSKGVIYALRCLVRGRSCWRCPRKLDADCGFARRGTILCLWRCTGVIWSTLVITFCVLWRVSSANDDSKTKMEHTCKFDINWGSECVDRLNDTTLTTTGPIIDDGCISTSSPREQASW